MFGYFLSGEITAFLKQSGITPFNNVSLTIFVIDSIKISICLKMNCVGNGSKQQDLQGDDKTIDLTSSDVSRWKSDMTV